MTLQKKPACLYFSEDTPKQTWEVQDSIKQIAGYSCQLAVTQFRGRLWYAWFSLDIPIDNGPWKLCGLPGLIMEAYDKQNYYHYTLTSIRTKDVEPIIFYNYWNSVFEQTTRLTYLKRAHKFITGAKRTKKSPKAHTKTDTSSQEKLFGEIQNSFLELDYQP